MKKIHGTILFNVHKERGLISVILYELFHLYFQKTILAFGWIIVH